MVQAKILKELLADGRKTDAEIAQIIGETKENVKTNILKLQEIGAIAGATIHINYKIFGYQAVAHLSMFVAPSQADQLVKYLQELPEVYSAYGSYVQGEVDAVTILKTLEQLNEIKDKIKKTFLLLEMRTGIWIDVKEMNDNLAIVSEIRNSTVVNRHLQPKCRNSRSGLVIDKTDQKIADVLAKNGRVTMELLGKEIGLSAQAVKRRYEKLKENGVLKVTIQVNPSKLGYQALCIFYVSTHSEKSSIIIEKIREIPDIISIMKTAGDYDLQIWAMTQDLDQLLFLQEKIGKIQGITKMQVEISRLENWIKWPSPRQYISTF